MTNIAFAGTPDIAATVLENLLVQEFNIVCCLTQPDRPKGRGQKLTQSPVKTLALAHQIPVLQPQSLKPESVQQELAKYNLDIMIVVAYGLLLPQPVLDMPKRGCLNIHASLLPRWRGAAPIQRAILAGDRTTGICLMKMEAGLDTGPVYASFECPIEASETSQSLHDKLATLGANALVETLPQILEGQLTPIAQDETKANYAAKITKEEACIDWSKSATEIEQQVRAFKPWPVAFFKHEDLAIKVHEAVVCNSEDNTQPGTIKSVSQEGIEISTGQQSLKLLTLQLPGKKPVSIKDLLNSKPHLFEVNTQL